MSGGIGDHIEQISQVVPVGMRYRENIKLITTRERYLQLKVQFQTYTNQRIIKAKYQYRIEMLLAAMGEELPLPRALFYKKNELNPKRNKMVLCCWNVQGKGDIISKWSRSVNFAQATKLYRILKEKGYSLSNIVDMSKWRGWEEEVLMKEGVRIFDPTKGDVMDTIKEIKK